jgi:polyisoprenoid-binding protein YceI
VTGDLTIHGVTKEVILDVDAPSKEAKSPFDGKARSGASATLKLNRKDFGLNWNKAVEAGGVMVGDEVAVGLELELVKKEAAVVPAVAPAGKAPAAVPAKGTK